MANNFRSSYSEVPQKMVKFFKCLLFYIFQTDTIVFHLEDYNFSYSFYERRKITFQLLSNTYVRVLDRKFSAKHRTL